MAIIFNTNSINYRLKDKRKVKNWIKEIIKERNKFVGNITFIFTSDSYILDLNRHYLKHNYFTDVITFDYSLNNIVEGDIFISVETVYNNSIRFKTSFDEEMLRVIIHGVLHLLGVNDKTKYEKAEMRINEKFALSKYR
jgi:probable rRNA maturation factor